MKEHESKICNTNEIYYLFDSNNEVISNKKQSSSCICYVDSNNFLHNLNGCAWDGITKQYYIHGKKYENKEEFDIERNRIKMLEEI